jgi:hypothetical protein
MTYRTGMCLPVVAVHFTYGGLTYAEHGFLIDSQIRPNRNHQSKSKINNPNPQEKIRKMGIR